MHRLIRNTLSAPVLLFFLLSCAICEAQVFEGAEAGKRLKGAEMLRLNAGDGSIEYAMLAAGNHIGSTELVPYLEKVYGIRPPMALSLLKSETDELDYTHLRFSQTYNNIPVAGGILIAHVKNGLLQSFNGRYFSINIAPASSPLSENECLQKALEHIGALTYKWQQPEEEAIIKQIKEDEHASWFPKGELVYCPLNLDYSKASFVLSYKFNVHASEPLVAENIYISVENGSVVARENMLHTTDVPGTALTKYSGTRTITTDSVAPGNYRLRENSRGNGIYTFNLKTGTNYGTAVDFTDANNNWNNVNVQKDEVATDAHWGAEETYDYYKLKFNRNSYDNNNARINSFVHYSTAYDNAFWNGVCMTYGDGNSYKPLTALDVCGHEITHAVTSYSANLVYSYESGALNESFSDIFGNAIERYSRPSQYSWKIGEDITFSGNGLRNMASPTLLGQPRCYKGTNWYTGSGDNGGVHYNSGVQNWWFYLVSEGGQGTNDFSNAYKVDSIGILKAEKIAYRTLTVYLTPSSQYADACFYSIRAATDLHGNCSKEVIAVTNAWYACNVGAKYDSGYVKADFIADTVVCSTSKLVKFTNLSVNSVKCRWYFGNGDTSTIPDPMYTYNTYGKYTVKLVAESCFKNKKDSLTKTAYIKVDSTYDICNGVLMKAGGTDSTNKCESFVYDEGGEGIYTQNKTSYFRISVPGADSIRLRFLDLDYEKNYDSLYLYSGIYPGPGSVKLGGFTGNTLPYSGNTITISGNVLTLKQFSDPFVVGRGFKLFYTAIRKPVKITACNDTTICMNTSATLYAKGSGGYYKDYRWSWKSIASNDTAIVSPVSNTTYKVYLTDVCSKSKDSAEVDVSVRAALSLQLNNDTTICKGRSVRITAAGTGGKRSDYRYTWDPPLTTDSFYTVKPADTATYRVILSDGCSGHNDTAYMTINVRPALSVKASVSDTIICYNNSISLDATASGGNAANYQYSWNAGLGSGKQHNTSLRNTTKFKVTLTDGCTVAPAADSVVVVVRDSLKVFLNNDTTICLGNSVKLDAIASGGKSSDYSYNWNQALSSQNSHTVSPVKTVKYLLTLKDNCSADAFDSITVTVLDALRLSNLKDTIICYGGTAAFRPMASGGKASQYEFEWDNGLDNSKDQDVSPLADNSYRLILKDNCTVKADTVSLTVEVQDKLTLNASLDPGAICTGDSSVLHLSFSGGIPSQYEWYVNSVKQNLLDITLKPTGTTAYAINLKDKCSVEENQNLSLTVNPLPVPAFDADRLAVCRNEAVSFNNKSTGAAAYTWHFTASDSSHADNPSFIYTAPGTYNVSLQAFSAAGCKASITKTSYISVIELPSSSFSFTPLNPDYLNPDVTFSNTSKDYSSFEWDFGDLEQESIITDPVHTYKDTGTYTVRLISRNSLGCADTATVNLYIKDVYTLFLPNVLSANGDNHNDTLSPEGRGIQSYKMEIYNRWGEKVFMSTDKGFDGRNNNGKALQKGSYLLILNITDFEGKPHVFKQMIELL